MAPLNGQSTQPEVPGVKGENSAGGDGVVGTGRRGVVGESETFQGVLGKSRDNAGIVGESQNFHAVFGISHSSNNGGLFGVNVSRDGKEQGFGVIGKGRVGVIGESETFQGVLGKSRDNAGVVGESEKFHAVFGISHDVNNAGVFGTNDKAGFGVIGVSEKGIGISGKGGKLAGRFEGIVEVTGALVVAKVDVTTRIAALERELAALKTRLVVVESKAGVSPPPPSKSASIGVELRLTGSAFDELRIFGSGFGANEPVALTVESVSQSGGGASTNAEIKADSQGAIDHRISVSCPAGTQTTHNVRARGLLTGRLSNNAAASC